MIRGHRIDLKKVKLNKDCVGEELKTKRTSFRVCRR